MNGCRLFRGEVAELEEGEGGEDAPKNNIKLEQPMGKVYKKNRANHEREGGSSPCGREQKFKGGEVDSKASSEDSKSLRAGS